jgi:hypothetical protein
VSRFHAAKVVDTHDPQGELRLKLQVPDVLGDRAVWAWPFVGGQRFKAPAEGAGVWVWFEQDDVERPLWFGVMPR